MAAPVWWAKLDSTSPRYRVWREILGGDEVPLQSPGVFAAELGHPVAETAQCYALDVRSMNGGQKVRLAEHIASRFGVPIREAADEIYERGFPIRESDVVAFSIRAFI